MATLIRGQETRFCASQGSSEWNAAWQALRLALHERGLGTGLDLAQECDGETWQYLCSERRDGSTYLIHEFRHRFHPQTLSREYVSVRSTCE